LAVTLLAFGFGVKFSDSSLQYLRLSIKYYIFMVVNANTKFSVVNGNFYSL